MYHLHAANIGLIMTTVEVLIRCLLCTGMTRTSTLTKMMRRMTEGKENGTGSVLGQTRSVGIDFPFQPPILPERDYSVISVQNLLEV